MKKAIFWMAAIALLAGCAKEQDTKEEVKNGKTYTITASVDNPETRTIAGRYLDEGTNTYKYAFSWEEDEQIAVVPTDVNTQLYFDLEDAENGTFSYTAGQGEPEYSGFGLAVTPADALTSTESSVTDFDIEFSGSYVQGCSNSIMVAGSPSIGGDGNWKFQFKHIAALVKVTYKNVPAGTAAMVFLADQNIAGTFHFTQATGIVAEHDASNMTLADSPKEARVMFKDEPETTLESVDFYLPIPTGAYQTFRVYLLDENDVIEGSEETFSATTPFTLNCGDVVACPEITIPGAVVPKGTVLLFEPFTDFSAEDTPTAPGNTTVVYGNATVSYSCSNGATDTKIFEENLAGGTSPELLVSRTNGEFAISGIPTGNHTSLTVTWNSNNHNIRLYKGDEEVSSASVEGTDIQYMAIVPVTAGSGSIDLSFKNTYSSNGRLDNIQVVAGKSNDPAGLAFGGTAFTAVLGDDFEEPVLTNPHSLTVTYASSDTDVAEVDAATGEVTTKAAGEATITASSEATDDYEAGQASYTITVVAPTLTLSEGTTPAKASCAQDATVTFTVTSNIAWSAAVEANGDVNNIVKSVTAEDDIVTVTFNKNGDAVEKTAVIAVNPTNDTHSALKKTITVTQEKFDNTDVLTAELIGVSNYSNWDGISVVSDAVYAGNSTKNNSGDIQLRGSSNSGIVSTTSGGYIRKVKITWGTGNASDGRTLNIYARNTKYQSASDLYTSGLTPIATLNSKDGTTEYEFTQDYEYVGVRSASNALYLADIAFTWEEVDPNAPKFNAAIVGDANIEADVTTGTVQVTGNVAWTATATNGATLSPASGTGEATITVTMPENESYTESASYVVTVSTEAEVSQKSFALTFTQAPAVNPDQNDGSLDKPYTVAEALAIIAGYTTDKQKSDSQVYVTGTIASVGEFNSSYNSVTYDISDDGTTSNKLIVYSGKFVDNTNFTSNTQIAAGDEVIVYGYLYRYNSTTPEIYQNNYIYSLNGKTCFLTAGTLTTSVNNDNKQVTVTWGAASGTEQPVSYVVTCGTQTFNATAAGSHTFTMADYGTYDVTVVASASNAFSATAAALVTLKDPTVTEDHTATIKFGSASGSTNVNDKSVTGTDSQNNTWTVTTVGTTSFTPNSAYAQIGSANKPAESITFTTTLEKSATIKSLSAKFGGFNGTAGTVTLKVGNQTVGTGSLNGTSDVTVDATNVPLTGTVLTVTVTDIAKGVKAYEINVTYNN